MSLVRSRPLAGVAALGAAAAHRRLRRRGLRHASAPTSSARRPTRSAPTPTPRLDALDEPTGDRPVPRPTSRPACRSRRPSSASSRALEPAVGPRRAPSTRRSTCSSSSQAAIHGRGRPHRRRRGPGGRHQRRVGGARQRSSEQADAKAKELGLDGLRHRRTPPPAPTRRPPPRPPRPRRPRRRRPPRPPSATTGDTAGYVDRRPGGRGRAARRFGTALQSTTSLDDLKSKVPDAPRRSTTSTRPSRSSTPTRSRTRRSTSSAPAWCATGPKVSDVLRRFLDAAATGDVERRAGAGPGGHQHDPEFQGRRRRPARLRARAAGPAARSAAAAPGCASAGGCPPTCPGGPSRSGRRPRSAAVTRSAPEHAVGQPAPERLVQEHDVAAPQQQDRHRQRRSRPGRRRAGPPTGAATRAAAAGGGAVCVGVLTTARIRPAHRSPGAPAAAV